MPQLRAAIKAFWTRDSSILLGGFFVVCILIVYIWWPLAEEVLSYINWNGQWWLYLDWLLIGIFMFMSIAILTRADLKTDLLIIFELQFLQCTAGANESDTAARNNSSITFRLSFCEAVSSPAASVHSAGRIRNRFTVA